MKFSDSVFAFAYEVLTLESIITSAAGEHLNTSEEHR